MYIYVLTKPRSIEKRRQLRRMAADVIPKDKSWQVYLTFAGIVTAFAVMFIRWWLCV